MRKYKPSVFYFFLIVVCFSLVQISYAQDGRYKISGKITGIGDAKVLLMNKPRGIGSAFKKEIYDSCYSTNDCFSFSGELNEIKFLSIEVPFVDRSWLTFIGENKDIRIDGDKNAIHDAKVSGSPQTDVYHHYIYDISHPAHINDEKVLDSLAALKDSGRSEKLISEYRTMSNRRDEADLFNQIVEHPDNYGLLYELWGVSTFIPRDSVQKYYSKFSNEIKRTSLGKVLYYSVFEYDKIIQKGKKMPDFSMPDTTQCMRSISDFRGKYVLLDFWASWCGPCLAELPALKKIDSLYRKKGLEIVGISLDTEKTLWKDAIKENNINWTNLSDLKGGNNKGAQLLRVFGIPARFLLDPKGNLLILNSPLAEVEELLSQIL
ncbi:peroxiredoxin [Chitinophaga polysaccharea]|uniref:Peroxiredoxin n=1 Tax=Chitinophaga polysaccharea TaxID=1293035 RepID=A0A561PPB9_9BACT|nr:TlpA disulfide reductase family protein [Chitinophaga polysaccharea]TWF39955.1 peroxiredoxin [Chitinophaga polysaccharea]